MSEYMAEWLELSTAMLRDLMPKGAGIEIFGHGMPPNEFAALVTRESSRVDHALTALATATSELDVRALFEQLSGDTVMVLFSRWAHYTEAWRSMLNEPNPRHWFPPGRRDWWRAIFLSMTEEDWYSTTAARYLWPGSF